MIAALLASIPSFERLYIEDEQSGFIDRLFVTGTPIWGYALVRIISHFLFYGGPLLLTLPILALFFGIEASKLGLLMVIVAVGLLSLTLLGSIGASLTLGGAAFWHIISNFNSAVGFPDIDIRHLSKRGNFARGRFYASLFAIDECWTCIACHKPACDIICLALCP